LELLRVTLGALLSIEATFWTTFWTTFWAARGALTVTLGALLLSSLGATARATAFSTTTPGKNCRRAGDEHHRKDEQQNAARGDVHHELTKGRLGWEQTLNVSR
jgi:hypothetical protein